MTFQQLAVSSAVTLALNIVSHPAMAQGAINSCRALTQPGSYTLTTDLSGKSYDGVTCFRIKVSNVTLDLGGHTIRGFNASPAYGVFADANATLGIKVVNGAVADFGVGVYLGGTFGSVVEHLQINVNKTVGLMAGTGAIIQHSQAGWNWGQGISANAGTYINDLQANSNGSDGVRVGLGSSIVATVAEFNGGYGIVLDRTLLGPFSSIYANTTGANNAGGISADCAGGVLQPNGITSFGLSVISNVTDTGFPDHGPHVVVNVPVVDTRVSGGVLQHLPEACQAVQSDAVIHKSDNQ